MSVLVIGAYGSVGGHVVSGLASAGVAVRGTSRNPASGESAEGVEMVALDLTKPETLPPALDGIKKVFLYASPNEVAQFVSAAQSAGVEHVVLLSSASVIEETTRASRNAQFHSTVEDALRESGLAWTFLQPTTFASKQLSFAPKIRAGETLRIPFLQLPTASIHERDIADVAVSSLTGDGHQGQAYWLTGPQALTQQQHIETIGSVIGRPIDFVEVEPGEAEPPYPEFVARMMAAVMAAPCVVTSAVEDVTGAPARTFTQWTEDHVKDFS